MVIFRELSSDFQNVHPCTSTIPVLDRSIALIYLEKGAGIQEEGILSSQFTAHVPSLQYTDCTFASQIFEYLRNKRSEFQMTLYYPKGFSPFFLSVYRGLVSEVPYGNTISYSALAKKIKLHGSARAIGLAMRMNPWPIIVPCHRVVTKAGEPGGYQGGVANKLALLELEQNGLS
jgi:O-6-methylguanine DNA methyltransferase